MTKKDIILLIITKFYDEYPYMYSKTTRVNKISSVISVFGVFLFIFLLLLANQSVNCNNIDDFGILNMYTYRMYKV